MSCDAKIHKYNFFLLLSHRNVHIKIKQEQWVNPKSNNRKKTQ